MTHSNDCPCPGETRAERFFWAVTARPRTIVALGIFLIFAMAAGLPRLVKDTTSDAFIADDNPAVVYRDRVKSMFGLDDPFVIALVGNAPGAIYRRDVLELVDALTDAVSRTDNIDPDRVTSLATESNIVGTADGMDVTAFYRLGEDESLDPARIRSAIEDFPLYAGSLVARDGSATLIVAEMIDEARGQQTYDDLLALAQRFEPPAGFALHVAGEAAVSGYLGTYIDRDAARLNPLSALVITLVLVVAFRTFAGALLPNVIVAATAAGGLGIMAFAGVSFFVITNGLLPILIGIAVADSIHILSEYYELAGRFPAASRRQHIVGAMVRMWRPVTLTTLTTVAGFMGLWIGAEMPPMRYFGLFAAVGVAVAWVYSVLFLPAAITLFPLAPSTAFTRVNATDRFGRWMDHCGRIVLGKPMTVIIVFVVIVAVGAVGASKLVVEEAQIANFQTDEPIYLADTAINNAFDGVNYLDVVIEASDREGLLDPNALRKIEALQRFGETLPGVGGSTSIADYVKQMHKAVNENRPETYRIPDDAFLIAQLFLLYSSSGDPTDLEEEIDYDYQRANVRFNLNTSYYRNNRKVIAALEDYVTEHFDGEGLPANLSGRVLVNYHWLKTIGDNHFRSLAISMLLVFVMAALVFRSAAAGLLALLPVAMSILFIYAIMGFGRIWLGVGTSMFAAIAIGLGIDFAVHTIDRMRELVRGGDRTASLDQLLLPMFATTGRALLFNFLAIGFGFVVLMTSEVPPLIRFGALVAVAVTAAFIGSMALMPTLVKVLRPRFLFGESPDTAASVERGASLGAAIVAVAGFAMLTGGGAARADAAAEGAAIMQAVVDRDEGEWGTRRLHMAMTDRNGVERTRDTITFRRYYGDEKRTVIYYTAPANVKDTAFLTYDYPDAERDDDQWLYLPALRKVRRISASDRGDYFLGTDFTYEDMKKENKIALEDYVLSKVDSGSIDGHAVEIVEGVPVDDETARELGYGRVRWHVDPAVWIPRRTESWDPSGNPLKTVTASDITRIDGIWTVERLSAVNHKTGHRTEFTFTGTDYSTAVEDKVFSTGALKRGAP